MTGSRFARFSTLLLAALVLAVLAAPAQAQRMTAELSGSVVDESGAAVPGADVTLTNESSSAVRRSVTNANGFFSFAAVPAGSYKLLVALSGFSSFEVTGLALSAGDVGKDWGEYSDIDMRFDRAGSYTRKDGTPYPPRT